MTNENKKNQGPTCACGRGDLFEDWLKQNKQKGKEEATDSISANKTGEDNSSANDANNDVQKQKQTKN